MRRASSHADYRYQGQNSQGVPQPALVLSYNPNGVASLVYHGPFHFSVISLSYQNTIFFQSTLPWLPWFPRASDGLVAWRRKSSRTTINRSPAGASAPADAAMAGNAPSRDVRFYLQMWVVPEPRMVFSGNGNVKLLEAVDELGQSLTSTASDDERAFGRRDGSRLDDGWSRWEPHDTPGRPESPGKLIKTLRGTVDTSVTSPRSNPLVISLEVAQGKTSQNGDHRVVVSSIATDPTRGQGTIELKFDDLDEVFPAEPAVGPGHGAGAGMMGRSSDHSDPIRPSGRSRSSHHEANTSFTRRRSIGTPDA